MHLLQGWYERVLAGESLPTYSPWGSIIYVKDGHTGICNECATELLMEDKDVAIEVYPYDEGEASCEECGAWIEPTYSTDNKEE